MTEDCTTEEEEDETRRTEDEDADDSVAALRASHRADEAKLCEAGLHGARPQRTRRKPDRYIDRPDVQERLRWAYEKDERPEELEAIRNALRADVRTHHVSMDESYVLDEPSGCYTNSDVITDFVDADGAGSEELGDTSEGDDDDENDDENDDDGSYDESFVDSDSALTSGDDTYTEKEGEEDDDDDDDDDEEEDDEEEDDEEEDKEEDEEEHGDNGDNGDEEEGDEEEDEDK